MARIDFEAITKLENKFKENGFSMSEKNIEEARCSSVNYVFDKKLGERNLTIDFTSQEEPCASLTNSILLKFREKEYELRINICYATSFNYDVDYSYSLGSDCKIFQGYGKPNSQFVCNLNDSLGNKNVFGFDNIMYHSSTVYNKDDPYNFRFTFKDQNDRDRCFEMKKIVTREEKRIIIYEYKDKKKRRLLSLKPIDFNQILSAEEIREVIDTLTVRRKTDSGIERCIVALELCLEQYNTSRVFDNKFFAYENFHCKNLLQICDFVIENSDKLLASNISISPKVKEFFDMCGFQLEEKSNPSHSEYVKAYSEMRGKDDSEYVVSSVHSDGRLPVRHIRGRRLRGK